MTHLRTAAFVVIFNFATGGFSDELKDPSERERRIERIGSNAAQLRMTVASDPDKLLKFREQPLLYWTNPARSNAFGGIYLWTRGTRPMAIAGVFVRVDPTETRVTQEFHSLTVLPLKVEFDGKKIWSPSVAGVEFRKVGESIPPAASALARLRQMKHIAGQFSIDITWPQVTSETLRLMSKPIYRYSDADSDVLDGAIFAFAQGTDAEVLLMVEAISGPTSSRWRYGFVRCTNWAIEARRDDKIVYNVSVARRDEADSSAAYYRVRRTTPN